MSGKLVLSVEIELAWGFHEFGDYSKLSERGVVERHILDLLLSLLEKYEIPITFNIVGHLFLEQCEGCHNNRGEWYKEDPGTSFEEAPLWYAPDMIEKILSSKVEHEIACHTFSHTDFTTCSAEIANKELKACRKEARKFGLSLETLVFPKNKVGHLKEVRQNKFKVFRSVPPRWKHENIGFSRNLLTLVNYLHPKFNPSIFKIRQRKGLTEIRSSPMLTTFLLPNTTGASRLKDSFFRFFPRNLLHTEFLKRGLVRVINTGDILCLFTHLYNITPEQVASINSFLKFAKKARNNKRLKILRTRDLIKE